MAGAAAPRYALDLRRAELDRQRQARGALERSEFRAVQARELLKAGRAPGGKRHFHAALVGAARLACYQAQRFAARHQRHHAVVLRLQALGKLADGRPLAPGESPDLQHEQVLEYRDPALAGSILAEAQETPQP